jgi:hypothetical protein
MLNKNGLKSDNHECLISFFKSKYPDYEFEILKIYQLKDVRKRINHDGIFVKKEYLEQNEKEFLHIIELLKEIILAN